MKNGSLTSSPSLNQGFLNGSINNSALIIFGVLSGFFISNSRTQDFLAKDSKKYGTIYNSPTVVSGSLTGESIYNSKYQNYLRDIQIFGLNSYQDSDYLVIQKPDLLGLSYNANNRGEQLFAAILSQAVENISLTVAEDNLSMTYWKTEYKNNFINLFYVIQHLIKDE